MIIPEPRVRPRLAPIFFLLLLVAFLPGLKLSVPSSAAPHSAPGQAKEKPYALIFGTVWGPDDQPVYGVKVNIRRAKDKKAKWKLYSDHNGEFAQRVPAGEADYVLWADLKGFKSAGGQALRLVREVTVHVYSEEREDTGLHLALAQP